MTKPQFFLPPEWAPQSGIMLTWPHKNNYWDSILEEAETTFAQIAAAASRFERVVISCENKIHSEHISQILQQNNAHLDKINLYSIPSNDAWVRDHGPMTVLDAHDHKPVLLDFIFNSWGNKYPCELDNQLTQQLFKQQAFGNHINLENIDFVLEGGSIDVDGQGTLLTTSSCLLSPGRNPGLTQQQITQKLQHYLGIKRVLWLDHGYLEGDDTDSHIDTLARFTDSHTICYVSCDDPQDPHYHDLQDMASELKKFSDDQGKPYNLVSLPWPKAKFSKVDGRRLPASYANFLIINQAVLFPIYNDVVDNQAIGCIKQCFPDREIIPINCCSLIENFGSLHCVTMQLPQGVLI